MTVLSREKINITILVVCQLIFMIAVITVMTLSGVVGKQLSPEPSLATLPIALMMLGTLISTMPASLYMSKVGRRLGFITGVTIGGFGGGLLCFIGISLNEFWLFCLGNLLIGLYQGFAMYYRFAATDVASPEFRSRALSLVMTGGIVAAFLGPWNASAMVSLIPSVPMGGPYLVISLLSLVVVMLLTQLKVPFSGEPHPGEFSRPMFEIIKQPNFLLAVLAATIGYTAMILVMSVTPLAMRAYGFEMSQVAFIMQCHVLGMFVPSFITGSLVQQLGVNRVLFSGSIFLIISAATAYSGHSFTHFLVSLVLLGVGWNFLFIGGSTLLSTLHNEAERGKTQGTNDLIVFFMVTIGSLMSGKLLYLLNWETLNLVVLESILLITTGVIIWQSLLRRRAIINV